MVQAIFVGLLVSTVGAFGQAVVAAGYGAGIFAATLIIWLCSRGARQRLNWGSGLGSGPERRQIGASLAAVLLPAIVFASLRIGRISTSVHFHSHGGAAVALALISLTAATLVFLSSAVDWFYVRPYLEMDDAAVTSTTWRTLTRVRVTHRLLAVLGVLGAATAVVALSANTWIRPIDDTVAAVIAALATIIAGYYTARAAPLLAIATNPVVQITDVVELAEEFNISPKALERRYVVIDIAWEGVKLYEVTESGWRSDLRKRPRPYDRMVDVADIARLLRRRKPLATARLPGDPA
jgi:hypothetical protein